MAANTPDRPLGPDEPDDPRPDEQPLLGPVEAIDAFDDGLVLTDDGARPPAGVPTPADDPAEAEHAARELGEAPPDVPPPSPAAAWLDSVTRLPDSPSAADIDVTPPPKPGEEPSDIFSTARRPPGSNIHTHSGAPADSADDAEDDAGGVDFDAVRPAGSPEVTGRVPVADDDLIEADAIDEEFVATDPNIALPPEDSAALSGFNRVDKSEAGSDLFADATVVDMNLLDGGGSGINLLDPDAPGGDPESMSSIFSKIDPHQPSDGGRVDLDAIPLLGHGEERTEAMFRPDGPEESTIFKGEGGADPSAVAFDAGAGDQDSASIDWSEPPAGSPKRIEATLSRRADADDDPDADDDIEAELSGRAKRPGDEESVFSLPNPAAAGAALSAVLGPAPAPVEETPRPVTPKGKVTLASTPPPAALPTRRRAATDDRPARRGETADRKSGGRLLVGALGVLVGAGLGAAGMYAANSLLAPEPKTTAAAGAPATPPAEQPAARPAAEPAPPDPALVARAAEAEKAQQQVKKLSNDLNAARDNATKLANAKKAADEANRKLAADAAASKKELSDRTKQAEAAKAELAAAEKRLKDAEAAVDAVVARLKEAKLIDPGADRAAAAAALPGVLKKVAAGPAKDPPAGDVAAALDAARKARDAAEAKAKAADTALATAKADAANRIAELEAAVKKFDEKLAAEAKKAADAARAEAEAKATADRAAVARQYEEKLTAQAEQFRKQLAAARAGAAVPAGDAERAAADRARGAYASGLEAYRVRQYGTAEAWFARAVKDDPADARYWYYLGLSKWSQGRAEEAAADFKTGAEWEGRGRPGRRAVGEALVPIQGTARAVVDAYRP